MQTIERNKVTLYHGDCLEVLLLLEAGSVDAVITDPPYGTTACKWDTVIPFEPMWKQLKRIVKPRGAIVMTASQPFTTALIASNLKMFKYCWVWDKVNSIRNHLNAKRQPMRVTEDIAVFYQKQCTYNYQKREGKYISRKTKPGQSEGFGKVSQIDVGREVDGLYPLNLLSIKGHDPNNTIFPTQKPIALIEYLIKTYTNEGETVLDFAMGSGTTGVACINTRRNFIGIEIVEQTFLDARERIAKAQAEMVQLSLT